ncbi:extracellular solute-binding protein [Lachnotalea glycerini]|uniref:Extracellular solute-binding protein n=1 Tax=Lachnotalea glycerini TaxID=1763509 RepID=A0A371JHG8_9FIRM|nr:extracellular solute-binding protein [Lachnotalea glycerini]RDY32188.1 extracellular solute-binding protein [Lachnotalea glycerini]
MTKKMVAALLTVSMVTGLMGCGASSKNTLADQTSDTQEGSTQAQGNEEYTFGADKTFYSDEPVSYSMLFSDHENYPYKEDWLLWQAIEEKTNVTFDLTLVARTDYEDKKSALVNSGSAPYIIPKTYDEAPYVASGQIVPISDWVQYMPNYQKCVQDWGMEEDLKQKLKDDGKYYVLPGMWESQGGGYSMIIRKDIFDAAGVDVETLEKNWTWEEFYDALKQVKEYTGAPYVWSDQYQGSCALNLAAVEYGVKAGRSSDGGDWGLQNAVKFDWDKMEFSFVDTSDKFKEFLSFFHKMYTEGIVDSETYTQDIDAAREKFFRGESYVLTANYQQLSDMIKNEKMQDENASLYMVTPPGGPMGNLRTELSRLENGIMISQNALDELGEEGFIKMLRFVDWLWYSNEGQTLSLWGVEGTTYTVEDSKIVLNPDIYFNGINPDGTKKLNIDYGFGGGVFAYGGTEELRASKMTEEEKNFTERVNNNREPQKIDPPILANEDETEEMELIRVPLTDYINTMTLSFITGTADLDADWDEYVKNCESKGSTKYIEKANEIFSKTKSILGY